MYEFNLQMQSNFLLTFLSSDPEIVYECICVYNFNFIMLFVYYCVFNKWQLSSAIHYVDALLLLKVKGHDFSEGGSV